jgi:hypothetical protein
MYFSVVFTGKKNLMQEEMSVLKKYQMLSVI